MSFEQLAAISAKVAERTREDGSSIGNAMKTIITRISKVNKMPQYAEEIDSSTVSKASESLAAVGVQVYKPSGEMNDMITILTQLREKWDGLSDAQQANIAFNIAATRQTSKFKNILMAWTDSMQLAEQATNSQGSALENQEKYEESIAGKTQKIRTEMDSFWIDLYNSDATKGILDFVINLAEAFNELADNIGPVKALVATTFGVMGLKGLGGGLFGMLKAGGGLSIPSLRGLQAYSMLSNISALNGGNFAATQDAMMKLFPKAGFADEAIKDMTSLEVAAGNVVNQNLQLVKTFALIAAAALAIYAVKKIYDEIATSTDAIIKRNERMIEQDAKRVQAIKDEKSDYDDNASSLQSLLDQYKEAEVGSDEYFKIRQQIADQSPELIVGYDAEGQAIIATNDQIQAQIDKYKELSLAKQEALRDQARENIQKETGETLTAGGQESYKELVNKRKELQDRYKQLQAKEAKGEETPMYDDMGNYLGMYKYSLDSDSEAQQILADLEKVGEQIGKAQTSLRDNYSLLVGSIDEGNEELVAALGNLETIASNVGISDLQFESMFATLRRTDFTKDNDIGEIMQNLLTPDYTKIKQTEYSDTMNEYLQQLASTFHLDQDTIDLLRESLDITANGELIKQSVHNITQNYGQQLRGLGIDYTSWLRDASVTDILQFDINDFLKQMFPEHIEKQFGDIVSGIKDKTVSELTNIDWNEAVTDPALQAIRGLSNMAIDWGLVDNIEEAIALFGELGLIIDDSVQGAEERFNEFKNAIEKSISNISTSMSAFNTAVSEQEKQGYISKDSLDALIASNSAYKDALIETATGIQLNTDKAKELQRQEKISAAKQLTDEQKELFEQYLNNEAEIERLNQRLRDQDYATDEAAQAINNQIVSLSESQAAIQDNISSWARYRDELLSTVNALNAWNEASQSANPSDVYNSITGGWSGFEDLHKKGWVGKDDYQSYATLLTGVENSDAIMEDSFYENVQKMAKRYLTEDTVGIDNFFTDALNALKEYGLNDWLTGDGGFEVYNDELFTHIMSEYTKNKYGYEGMGSALVQEMLSSMADAGWGNPEQGGTYTNDPQALKENIAYMEEYQEKLTKGSEEWKTWGELIKNAKVQLAQLEILAKDFKTPEELAQLNEQANSFGTQTQVEIPDTIATAWQADQTLGQLEQQKSEMIEMGVEIDPEAYKAVLAEIDFIYAKKVELEQPAIMKVDTSQLDDTTAEYVQLIQLAQQASDAYKIAKHRSNNGTGSHQEVEEAQSSADQAAQAVLDYQNQHPEIKVSLGLEEGSMEAFNTAIAQSGDSLNQALKVDDAVLGPVQQAYEALGGNIDTVTGKASNLGSQISSTPSVGSLGFIALSGYISTASTHVDSLKDKINLLEDKEVKIKITQEGNVPNLNNSGGTGPKYQGTAHFSQGTAKFSIFGRADARGDIGAKKTEPALTGELGPELRVRGSRWELLGQDGAEFNEVRKGDIIFNHKQTEELLKNGHINSRGQMAFAGGTGGTAFADGPVKRKKRVKTGSTDDDSSTSKKTTPGKKGDSKKNNKKDDTDKKLEKFKKLFENIFDWIEVKISRTTDKIESYSSKAEAALDKAADAASTGILNFYEDTAKKTKDLYDIAAANYHNAISEIYKQIGNEDRGSQYYYSFANKAMKTARSKGLITKGEEKKYKALVQNGEIKSQKDIDQLIKNKKDLSGHKLSEKGVARLSEAINLYKEWYEKGHEAEKAMEELNEQLREQVKSLKEVRDAERDARIERSKTLTQIKTGGFQATNDTDASYSNMLVNASNADLDIADKAYGNETKMLVSQRDKYGKQAKRAFKDAKSYINKTAKGKNKKNLKKAVDKLSKTYLKDIKKYVDKGQLIPEDTISKIQKTSPEAAARLIAYNQTVANLQAARLEEVAAYAENAASRTNNTNSLYENIEQAYNNDISLKESQKENRTTAVEKNTLLDQEIGIQRNITANAQKRLTYWMNQRKDLGNTISITNLKSMGLSGKDETEVNKALQAAHDGQAIPNMDKLADLYSKGKISDNFMEQCIRYNEWLEAEKSAQYAYDMAMEAQKKENSARAYEEVKNFRDEADYNAQSRLGNGASTYSLHQTDKNRFAYNTTDSNEQRITRAKNHISLAGTQGYYAQESDYDEQLQMSNRNMELLLSNRAKAIDKFNARVESGDLVPGTPDYASSLAEINGFTNDIESLTESIIELSKAKRQLKWTEFDDGMAAVKRFNAEIQHYQNILANQTLFDDDNRGQITEYGLASLDLHTANYSSLIAETQKYAEEIGALQKRIESQQDDIADKDVRDRLEQLTDAYWESVEATEAEKQAIIDLVRQAYESQLSYLNKTIDKYKELKNAEKDAYDYQKQISESSKNITNLEKQLAAFEGNTSEEAVARVQKLRADLKEARQNQSDQQYDKYLSDSQKMLDDLSNNFQEWIESHMKDRDAVIKEAAQVLAGNINNFGSTEFAKSTVQTLNSLESGLGGKVDSLSSALTSALTLNGDQTTTASLLNDIFKQLQTYIAQQPDREAATKFETRAEGLVNKLNQNQITLDDEASVNELKQYYDSLTQVQKDFVNKSLKGSFDAVVTKVSDLRKAKDGADRPARPKADKAELTEDTQRQADAVFAAITKQNKGVISTNSKNTTQVDKAKERALLDQIEDIRNQMRVNRDKYRVVKNASQKADLDKQYNDLQVKLNKLFAELAKLTKASTASKNSTVYQALNPLASAFAPSTAKGTAKTYASGSSYIKKDQLAYTQDKGQEVIYRKSDGAMLTPLGKGDKVFTNAMSENLWKLAQMNIPDMINSAMSQPIVQNMNQNVNQSMGDVQFVINLYGVENYDKFKSQLVADTQFQNALQEMTLGAAMGRNSLSKFKYN